MIYHAEHLSFRLLMELYSFLFMTIKIYTQEMAKKVSVSLWSYIHSYVYQEDVIEEIYDILVSVSLWSYIHSYAYNSNVLEKHIDWCFRLLMELYSFLLFTAILITQLPCNGFRLLMELYSFLSWKLLERIE